MSATSTALKLRQIRRLEHLMSEPIAPGLNPNAARWADALESGDYPQTRCALRTPDGYCVLGVACELYRLETGNGHWLERDSGGQWWYVLDGQRRLGELPHQVADWLGLASPMASYGRARHLGTLNDNGASFASLAAIIRSQPPGLFTAPERKTP